MMNEIVIGALSTLTTFMAPLAGTLDPNHAAYKLNAIETPSEGRCPSARQTDLILRIEQSPAIYFTLTVEGHICTLTHGVELVGFSFNLPADLLDDAFIAKLPTNAAYVVSSMPSTKNGTGKSRLKITKLAPVDNLVPIRVEWLASEDGKIEHPPMTVWLKKILDNNQGFSWSKVGFSDFGAKLVEPVEISVAAEGAGTVDSLKK